MPGQRVHNAHAAGARYVDSVAPVVLECWSEVEGRLAVGIPRPALTRFDMRVYFCAGGAKRMAGEVECAVKERPGGDADVGRRRAHCVEGELAERDEGVGKVRGKLGVCGGEDGDEVFLPGADGALRFEGAVHSWWSDLRCHAQGVEESTDLRCILGVDPFEANVDLFCREPRGGFFVGVDLGGGCLATHRHDVDIVTVLNKHD
mmetsp:Transcript_17706/g.44973  ORF Transcript_17706/g.44973 Transcript_17706/m.44973 type:complete len:204 (-) Transcript_17706:19-630(-)